MLRLVVLILLLFNAVYLAWGQGWLLAYGWGPTSQSEPQRLGQQIRPQALELISDAAAVRALAAPSTLHPAVCLQSVWLSAEQAAGVRQVLQASWPPDAWTLDRMEASEQWIIYMGKFANPAELAKKRTQLDSLRLTFYPLGNTALEPGLSLGVYASQQQADEALEALKLRGVRTARVLQDSAAAAAYRLHLPAVDEALQKQLTPVRAALAGKALEPCRAAPSQSP